MRFLTGRRSGVAGDEGSSGSNQCSPRFCEKDSNSSVTSTKSSRRAKALRKALRRKRGRNRKERSEQQHRNQGIMDKENSTPPTADSRINDNPSHVSEQDVAGTDSFSLLQQEQLSFESQKFTTAAELAILHHSYTNEEEVEPPPPSLLESQTQSFRPTIEAALSSRMVNDTRSEYSESRWQNLGEGESS